MDFTKVFTGKRTVKKQYENDVYFIFKPITTREYFALQRKHTTLGSDAESSSVDEVSFAIDTGLMSLVGWEGVKSKGKAVDFNDETKEQLFNGDRAAALFIMGKAADLVQAKSKKFEAQKKK